MGLFELFIKWLEKTATVVQENIKYYIYKDQKLSEVELGVQYEKEWQWHWGNKTRELIGTDVEIESVAYIAESLFEETMNLKTKVTGLALSLIAATNCSMDAYADSLNVMFRSSEALIYLTDNFTYGPEGCKYMEDAYGVVQRSLTECSIMDDPIYADAANLVGQSKKAIERFCTDANYRGQFDGKGQKRCGSTWACTKKTSRLGILGSIIGGVVGGVTGGIKGVVEGVLGGGVSGGAGGKVGGSIGGSAGGSIGSNGVNVGANVEGHLEGEAYGHAEGHLEGGVHGQAEGELQGGAQGHLQGQGQVQGRAAGMRRQGGTPLHNLMGQMPEGGHIPGDIMPGGHMPGGAAGGGSSIVPLAKREAPEMGDICQATTQFNDCIKQNECGDVDSGLRNSMDKFCAQHRTWKGTQTLEAPAGGAPGGEDVAPAAAGGGGEEAPASGGGGGDQAPASGGGGGGGGESAAAGDGGGKSDGETSAATLPMLKTALGCLPLVVFRFI